MSEGDGLKHDSKVIRLGSFFQVPRMELACFKTLQQCAEISIKKNTNDTNKF
jgi:hypothetical protein